MFTENLQFASALFSIYFVIVYEGRFITCQLTYKTNIKKYIVIAICV